MTTKEQIAQLSDDVRIPVEILLERLKEISFLPKTIAASDDGGIALFFEHQWSHTSMTLTADIEIDGDGTVTASVIPYERTEEGLDLLQSDLEPVDLWEVEEEPPFEETISRIRERLAL